MRLGLDPDPRVIVGVDCSPDPRGEEEFQPFCIGNRRIEVVEVLDRWPDCDHCRSPRSSARPRIEFDARGRTGISAV